MIFVIATTVADIKLEYIIFVVIIIDMPSAVVVEEIATAAKVLVALPDSIEIAKSVYYCDKYSMEVCFLRFPL